jgi:predicted transcriptional regulator
MPSPTATRSRQLKVTMTPEMHSRLVSLASRLGQTPASVASMAISLYVAQQENSLGAGERMARAMADTMGPELQRHLNELTNGLKDPAE